VRTAAAVLLAFAFSLAATPLHAADAPLRILFVGNSFTHTHYDPARMYNNTSVTDENFGVPAGDPRAENYPGPWGGVPGIIAKFASETGRSYDIHLELISGKPLEYHLANALPIITKQPWDIVVLQEQSTYPTPANRGGHEAAFEHAADALEAAIHAKNPKAAIYLYETWPRADLMRAGKPYAGEPPLTMAHDLHDGYDAALRENGHFAGIAPVGDAWLRAMNEGVALADPSKPEPGRVDLWNIDDYHPSSAGAYLAACVIFERISGTDVRTLGANESAALALGLAAHTTDLQRIAHEETTAK
jgi:hypothetical protein